MTCKNCGAKLKQNAKVCQNCGAPCGDDDGYYVLSSDSYGNYADYGEPERRKPHIVRTVLFVVVVVASLVAILYFTGLGEQWGLPFFDKNSDAPSLSFSTGAGVINDDEKVLYLTVNENSKIQYIHGVKLFAYNKTQDKNTADPISTDYEYTKSVGGEIRAIYFDVDELNLETDQTYTYTIEAEFQFYDSDRHFTYDEPVTFSGEISENVADKVFDHSMQTTVSSSEPATEKQTTTQPTTEKPSTTAASTEKTGSTKFLQNSFWFTAPDKKGNDYAISAIKFSNGTDCSITKYTKSGNAAWKTSVSKGTYSVSGDKLTVTDSDGTQTQYSINFDYSSVSDLTARKYNSVKNAEDFFGM